MQNYNSIVDNKVIDIMNDVISKNSVFKNKFKLKDIVQVESAPIIYFIIDKDFTDEYKNEILPHILNISKLFSIENLSYSRNTIITYGEINSDKFVNKRKDTLIKSFESILDSEPNVEYYNITYKILDDNWSPSGKKLSFTIKCKLKNSNDLSSLTTNNLSQSFLNTVLIDYGKYNNDEVKLIIENDFNLSSLNDFINNQLKNLLPEFNNGKNRVELSFYVGNSYMGHLVAHLYLYNFTNSLAGKVKRRIKKLLKGVYVGFMNKV